METVVGSSRGSLAGEEVSRDRVFGDGRQTTYGFLPIVDGYAVGRTNGLHRYVPSNHSFRNNPRRIVVRCMGAGSRQPRIVTEANRTITVKPIQKPTIGERVRNFRPSAIPDNATKMVTTIVMAITLSTERKPLLTHYTSISA